MTKLLYIGTITVNVALVAVMDLLVRRTAGATGDLPPPDVATAVANVLLLVTALILALVLPGASYYTLLLLAVDQPVVRLWRRATRSA